MPHNMTTSLYPTSRIAGGSLILGLVTLICLPTTLAQKIIKQGSSKKSRGAFPTLSVLPEGSILRRVRLIRYDDDFKATSMLAANQLIVRDRNIIEAEDANIELYASNHKLQTRAKMRKAIYNQKESTLIAQEAIYLEGKGFIASGSGLTYHWISKQGFLNGPASSRFTYKKDIAMNPSHPPAHHVLRMHKGILLSSFLTLNTTLLADPPAQLTIKQLEKLEMMTNTVTPKATEWRNNVQDRIKEQSELNNNTRSRIEPFLKNINQETLLVQNTAEIASKVEPNAQNTRELKQDESTLLVECDGGLYFDNEAGVLAYLKNIRLTNDRFKLTCSNELKVFLNQSEEPQKLQPDDKKKDGQFSSFGKLKQILATGSVKVTRLDDKGTLFTAMSETASYDAETGEIILRGGSPKLQQASNQYLQAQEPNQWIRILKNGKMVTSKGKWKMVTLVKKTPTKPAP